jgi:hypothetical protein
MQSEKNVLVVIDTGRELKPVFERRDLPEIKTLSECENSISNTSWIVKLLQSTVHRYSDYQRLQSLSF